MNTRPACLTTRWRAIATECVKKSKPSRGSRSFPRHGPITFAAYQPRAKRSAGCIRTSNSNSVEEPRPVGEKRLQWRRRGQQRLPDRSRSLVSAQHRAAAQHRHVPACPKRALDNHFTRASLTIRPTAADTSHGSPSARSLSRGGGLSTIFYFISISAHCV